MKIDYIIKKVESAGFDVEQNRRNGNNLGTVLKLSNGCIIRKSCVSRKKY